MISFFSCGCLRALYLLPHVLPPENVCASDLLGEHGVQRHLFALRKAPWLYWRFTARS